MNLRILSGRRVIFHKYVALRLIPCLALFAAALLLRAGVLLRLTQGWLSFEHDLFVAERLILSKISCWPLSSKHI